VKCGNFVEVLAPIGSIHEPAAGRYDRSSDTAAMILTAALQFFSKQVP
jgi:hypothetical protein